MVMPNMTTNLPNGVTNVGDATSNTLGSYPAQDPSRLHQWFDDFDQYTTADWTISGTAGTGTIAVQNEDGGVLKLTTGGTEDDARLLQWSGSTNAATVETFKWEAGKGLWFKTKIAVSEATESDWLVGLQITDTSPFDAADGFWFSKVDGATAVKFQTAKTGGTTTSTTILSTLAVDTYITLGFWWNPDLGVLTVYYNGNPVLALTDTASFPTRTLTISFGIAAGTGSAVSLSLDYLMAGKDRHATLA